MLPAATLARILAALKRGPASIKDLAPRARSRSMPHIVRKGNDVEMTVDEALAHADKWHMPSLDTAAHGVLADEVRRLRDLLSAAKWPQSPDDRRSAQEEGNRPCAGTGAKTMSEAMLPAKGQVDVVVELHADGKRVLDGVKGVIARCAKDGYVGKDGQYLKTLRTLVEKVGAGGTVPCHECGWSNGHHSRTCRGYLVDPETGEPIPTHNLNSTTPDVA